MGNGSSDLGARSSSGLKKADAGQKAAINRLKAKLQLGSSTSDGVVSSSPQFTMNSDGTIDFEYRTLKTIPAIKSVTIGVSDIPEKTREVLISGKLLMGGSGKQGEKVISGRKRKTIAEY